MGGVARQGERLDPGQRLEQGQAPLDEALALWQRGEQLYAICRAKLDAAQGKVEELARRVEQSRPETEP